MSQKDAGKPDDRQPNLTLRRSNELREIYLTIHKLYDQLGQTIFQ